MIWEYVARGDEGSEGRSVQVETPTTERFGDRVVSGGDRVVNDGDRVVSDGDRVVSDGDRVAKMRGGAEFIVTSLLRSETRRIIWIIYK